MSVPHIDSRMHNGKHYIFFGPKATWSPKFLKIAGSMFDLIKSVKPYNLLAMLQVAFTNFALTKYLIVQTAQGKEKLMNDMRQFYPNATSADWKKINAGQRVQIIKKDPITGKGMLQFGTEVVSDAQHSVAVLLGASPGASIAPAVMIEALEALYPDTDWTMELEPIFSKQFGSFKDNPDAYRALRASVDSTLGLL
jgi:malate dehydrogenase (quinone)